MGPQRKWRFGGWNLLPPSPLQLKHAVACCIISYLGTPVGRQTRHLS